MENLPQQNNILQNTALSSSAQGELLLQEILKELRSGLHIDNMNGNVNVYGQTKKPFPAAENQNYYNLFVISGSDIKSDHFQMPVEYCLNTRYGTNESISKWLMHLRDLEIQAELLKFPSILATKTQIINGRINPRQECQYGFLSDISVERGYLDFYFNFSDGLDQTVIEALTDELHLKNNPRATEMSVIHWAVKQADLVKILVDNGQHISYPKLK